jgi:ParB family transcriptional regulator, chromosome partitioning protein
MKKRGLGRSLNAILSTQETAAEAVVADTPTSSVAMSDHITHLDVDQLQAGRYQPRRTMDEPALAELADSIKTQGVLQPVIVRQIASGQFEIIAGERRCRAARLAGLQHVPALVRDVSDESAMAIGLIENIQRQNLNPIEEAVSLQRLLDEFGLTHLEAAEAVGRSRTAVSNLLRLLNLHDAVRLFVEHGDLEMGHARALLALEGDQQVKAAKCVVEKNMSVRDTEHYVRQLQAGQPFIPPKPPLSPDIVRLQQQFNERLDGRVKIKHNASGKGKLLVSYKNISELEALLARIE